MLNSRLCSKLLVAYAQWVRLTKNSSDITLPVLGPKKKSPLTRFRNKASLDMPNKCRAATEDWNLSVSVGSRQITCENAPKHDTNINKTCAESVTFFSVALVGAL